MEFKKKKKKKAAGYFVPVFPGSRVVMGESKDASQIALVIWGRVTGPV
jgi:hypothetical protein